MEYALGWLETLSTILVFVIGLFLLAVAVMFVIDVTQTKHTVRRNFPVIGRFRYAFEHMGLSCVQGRGQHRGIRFHAEPGARRNSDIHQLAVPYARPGYCRSIPLDELYPEPVSH